MDRSKTPKRKYTKREKPVSPRPVRPVQMEGGTLRNPQPLVCLLGGAAIVKDNGPATGIEYKFRPGGVTPVDERDYAGLLARRTNPKRCCGRQSPPEPQPIYGIA